MNKMYKKNTLKGWTKYELIKQILILQNNYQVANERFENVSGEAILL